MKQHVSRNDVVTFTVIRISQLQCHYYVLIHNFENFINIDNISTREIQPIQYHNKLATTTTQSTINIYINLLCIRILILNMLQSH